eukprot:TRINITY_DN7793_c0_g1_i1.p1 TRINITY_DN7793_c0_g1~~TRINITY_DN7793_c0_g1_i1.p1  ORF type:complete len:624 (+),score=138.80 TRINITY_DN7793_c0_g1_i1:259-2130(+)
MDEEGGAAPSHARRNASDVVHAANDVDVVNLEVELVWRDISYTIPSSRNCCCLQRVPSKQILHNVSGYVRPGQLLAIIGSSGAGKSSLLNALAHRLPSSHVSGEILLNGEVRSKKFLKRASAYVLQDDKLMPLLTVRETLRYAALFRLPSSVSDKEKFARVDATIEKLGLSKVRSTFIQNLSGGERRRTSIGVELVTEPGLVYLDEPTSGLDSKTALGLVENLADLAHRFNHTIICTIHQPRARIFSLFDNLMVMAKGHVVYFGDANKAVEYYESKGYPCPVHENPPDFFVDLTTFDPLRKEESWQRTDELIGKYTPLPIECEHFDAKSDMDITRGSVSIFEHFIWIFDRSIKSVRRNYGFLVTRMVQTVLVAIVVAALWWQIDDDQTGASDRTGLLVLAIINNSFNEILAILLIFAPEQEVVRREISAGMYSPLAYYLAKLLADFPVQMIFPATWGVIVYWATGLQADLWKFLTNISIIIATGFVANSYGIIITTLVPIESAGALAPLAMVVNLIFSGFFVAAESIPVPFRWITWLSFMRYSWSGLMMAEFTDLDLSCTSEQEIRYSTGNTTVTSCPFTKGEDWLDAKDVVQVDAYVTVLILWGIVLGARTLAFFFFWLKNR